MAEDTSMKEYMAYIRKNPKFVAGGHMDDGFYYQPDESKLGVEFCRLL